ncbi:MAG: DUF1499 domain-containing protein [Planctomycetales bacterium]
MWRLLALGVAALLVGAVIVFTASMIILSRKRPDLGTTDGRLRDCPSSPNCVCTQATAENAQMEPLAIQGSAAAAWDDLHAAVAARPGATIIQRTDDYLHAEFTTNTLRFIDDVELLLDAESGVIHFRSASRVGHSDLGANRRRMEEIRRAFENLAKPEPSS